VCAHQPTTHNETDDDAQGTAASGRLAGGILNDIYRAYEGQRNAARRIPPEDPLANSGIAYIMLFHDNDPDGVSNSLFKNPQSSVHFI